MRSKQFCKLIIIFDVDYLFLCFVFLIVEFFVKNLLKVFFCEIWGLTIYEKFLSIFICPFKYLILLELVSDEKAIVEEIKHYEDTI